MARPEYVSKAFDLDVRGIRLRVYDSGREREYPSSTTLVFLHGMPGRMDNWKYQVPFFAEKYRVVAYDQRGYGDSDKPEKVSISDYIMDLEELLSKLGVAEEDAVLVGHSFGGMIAQAYARNHRVKGLVLIASLLRFRYGLLDYIIWYAPPILWKPLLFKKNRLTLSLYRSLFFSPNVSDELYREFVEDNADYIESLPASTLRYDRFFRDYNAEEWLSEVASPTLVVAAEYDRVAPLSDAERICELIPGARLEVIRGAGHMLLYEKAGELNRVIEEFVASLEGKRQ